MHFASHPFESSHLLPLKAFTLLNSASGKSKPSKPIWQRSWARVFENCPGKRPAIPGKALGGGSLSVQMLLKVRLVASNSQAATLASRSLSGSESLGFGFHGMRNGAFFFDAAPGMWYLAENFR